MAFEESPDITGQGGRWKDPGKPAGKYHRKETASPPSHVTAGRQG